MKRKFNYESELVKYPEKDDVYKVEKVWKTRTKNGNKNGYFVKWIFRKNGYFVKWFDYPDSFNSWVKENDLTDL